MENGQKIIISLVAAAVLGIGYHRYKNFSKEKEALEHKLVEDRLEKKKLEAQVAADERKLFQEQSADKMRKDSLQQNINDKLEQIKKIDEQIAVLKSENKNAQIAQIRADMKSENDIINSLNSKIKDIGQMKKNENDQSKFYDGQMQYNYGKQDQQLQISQQTAEASLGALRQQLSQINQRRQPQDWQAKHQEVENQKAVVNDLKNQRNQLKQSFNLEKNKFHNDTQADQSQMDRDTVPLKAQIEGEKKKLADLDKSLKALTGGEDDVKNQLKLLYTQKHDLENEVRDLQSQLH